jgi:PAS domain S-box-containing protein
MRAMAANGDGAARQDQALDLQLLVNSAPSLIHTGTPDGYLDFFNQTWLRYVGRSLEDLEGWKWTAYIHPEDVDGIVEKWRASLASGEPFLHEARVLRVDGEYRWMLHHKVASRDGSGQIVKWYGSSIDIEDRKRAEGQLQQSAQELRRSQFYLAEGQRLAHMGSWAFDPQGFEYWSPELFRMHGLDPAGKPPGIQEYLAFIHPQDRESMANLIKELAAKASPFDATKRIVQSHGEVRYIRCVGAPVVEDQRLKKYVGSAIDVTEHELATQELRRREAYLAEAQRLSHTGSFGWRPGDGEIVWSEETYSIFEYGSTLKPTLDSVVRRVHPQDRALVQQVTDRAFQTGSDFEHEYRLLLDDGRVKYVHAIAHAVQNASGDREFIGAVTDVTERKTAEDKIRRLVDAGILGIFFANVDGAIVEANQAFLQMLQYDRQDLASGRLRWADLTPSEWRERDERSLKKFLETGVFHYEKEFFRKDGSRVPVLVGGARLQNPNEGVVFVLDLSEQKRAEEKIRISESYLAEAQRLTQTGSWANAPTGEPRYWSEECYRVLGFDPAEPLPSLKTIFQRIHPDDRAAMREQLERGIRDKTDFEVDMRIVHPITGIRNIRSTGHAVLDQCGELGEMVGTVIDMTERKRAEEKIREQEMEFRQILDFAPFQVAVLRADGKAIYLNKAGLDYHGLSREAWQDYDPHKLIHPDDHDRILTGAGGAKLGSGEPFENEARLLRKDGQYRWFLFRFNPLRDGEGRVTRWYVTNADIEDRKKAEERLQNENVALREEIDKASMFEEIVGTSKPLKAVLSRIARVAPTDSTVLITGETGTGKELIARAIHKRSDRSGRPFVSVNCAALAPTLVSSELFGHEKGAFTGATQRHLGRFEMADGGTIFLDEVGELLPDTQAALLRVLQEREFDRVGGGQPVQVDVRVIAATNRDLNAAAANGTFRQDLLYRLNVFPIEMPPLRERKDDILILVEYFVQRYANRTGRNIRSIDQKTLHSLQSYDWPGNIRELQNVIERSIILSSTDVFSVDELWLSKGTSSHASRVETSPASNVKPQSEREIIEAALTESRGRVAGASGAAARLRVPPSTLETRIKALKIDKRRFKFR